MDAHASVALLASLRSVGGLPAKGPLVQLILSGMTHAPHTRGPRPSAPAAASAAQPLENDTTLSTIAETADFATSAPEGSTLEVLPPVPAVSKADSTISVTDADASTAWVCRDIADVVLSALLPIASAALAPGEAPAQEGGGAGDVAMLFATAEDVVAHSNAAVAALNVHRFLLLRHHGRLPQPFAEAQAEAVSELMAGHRDKREGAPLCALYVLLQLRVRAARASLVANGSDHARLADQLGLLELAVESALQAVSAECCGHEATYTCQ
jgi:hypothetical protein